MMSYTLLAGAIYIGHEFIRTATTLISAISPQQQRRIVAPPPLQLEEDDYELIPGGVKSLEKLRQEESALNFIREWDALGKTIGSICHGGQMLISAEIVDGREVSGYYSIKDDLVNAGGTFVDAEYVISDNLICCPHYKWMGQWMAKVIEINNAV